MAASVLMKVMYAARMARFDLLHAVQGLARFLTKWSSKQDEELCRLMCYINSMVGWVGDEVSDIGPVLFTDADFASCSETRRSTTGVYCCLRGPMTSFPKSE